MTSNQSGVDRSTRVQSDRAARTGGAATPASRRESLLPSKSTPPMASQPSILLYGPSKSGKTTFVSHFERTIYLATEPGLNALDVFQVPITSWEQFLATCAELAAGDHQFKTVAIDTVDNLHKLASDYVRRMLSIPHEADAPYGKGFGLVNDELHRALHKLAFLPLQLVLVSHSEEREIETRTGKITRTVPSLPEKTRRIVLALVDLILFVDIEPSDLPRRVIRTKPNPRYEAGDRTGRLPETLEFDYDALQAALKGQEESK